MKKSAPKTTGLIIAGTVQERSRRMIGIAEPKTEIVRLHVALEQTTRKTGGLL